MRTITKIVIAGASALAVAVVGTAVVSSASAEAPDPLVVGLEQRLDRFGVDEATQEALLAKFLRGEALDADRGAEPVSETSRTEAGRAITRYVYADGSVAEASAVVPMVGNAPSLIEGCRHTVHIDMHTYSGCKVSWDAATWSGGFVAKYGYYQFGSFVDSVAAAWFEGAGDITGILASVPVPSCNSSCTSWGQASATQKITVKGLGITRTIGVKISVNNSNMKGGKSSSFG